jgi:NitT/TauT family transport system substrate-binding protein
VPKPQSILVALVVSVLVVGCSSTSSTPAPSGSGAPTTAGPSQASVEAGPSQAENPLIVGLGYIPSVQFAPFYLGLRRGYYTAEHVYPTFQNEIDANLVPKVGSGQIDIGLADGTSVIPAASQGIPIRYLATIYGKFPSIVFAKASSGIKTAADLKGRKIGIPGKYGSSWVMLQALLASAKLSTSDVTIVEYPDFGQGAAVAQGAVDAATGFVNNEPVQLEQSGTKATVLTIDAITPLPGPGLIAASATIQSKRMAIAAFGRATLKAMNDIVADPSVGLDASIEAVPELASQRPLQQAILAATIGAWGPPGVAPSAKLTGAIDADGWTRSIDYLKTLGLVAAPVTTSDVVDPSFTSGP